MTRTEPARRPVLAFAVGPMQPARIDTPSGQIARTVDDLVVLDRDHPGFRDADYRRRRNDIARAALEYRGGPVPDVEYSAEEQDVWRQVWRMLDPLHERLAAREYLDIARQFAIDKGRIPQLSELNPRLNAATGFEMQPVAGLINGRTFLSHLGERIFLSTQYIRHHSVPLYTPEPDVVHELVGHAATLIHPAIATLSQHMGRAAQVATDHQVEQLENLYWYTLEYGVVREGGELKAIGAGILSSAGEMERFQAGPLRDWDLELMAATPYDPTDYQPHYYVAPSFEHLIGDLTDWVDRRIRRPKP